MSDHPPPTCPDCDDKLTQLEDSGHWHCPSCDWQGIIDLHDDWEGAPI